MKKYIITLTAVISSIIFVGCKKEMVQEPELDANNGGGSHYVTLTVTMPETKISHEQDGNKVIRNWEVGDIIRIDPYGTKGSKGYLKLNSTEDISDGGKTATFSGTIAELQVGEKLNIYHHKNTQGQTIANNIMLSSQTGAVEDLPEVLYCINYEVTDTENLVVELNSILTYFHFHFDQSNKPTNFPTDDCTFKSVTLRKTSGSALLHQKVDLRYTNYPSRSEHTVGDITVTPSTPFTYSASSDWAIDFYVAAFISGSESDYTGSNFQLYFNNADYVSGNDNDYADIQHLSVSWTPTKVYSTGKVYKATSANTTFTSEYVSGWVGDLDRSDIYSSRQKIQKGEVLHVQFENYNKGVSGGAAIWNNWILGLYDAANAWICSMTSDNRENYCIWWNAAYNSYLSRTQKTEWMQDGDTECTWVDNTFIDFMNGAVQNLDIEFTTEGILMVSANAVKDNSTLSAHMNFYTALPTAGDYIEMDLKNDYSKWKFLHIWKTNSSTYAGLTSTETYYIYDKDLVLATSTEGAKCVGLPSNIVLKMTDGTAIEATYSLADITNATLTAPTGDKTTGIASVSGARILNIDSSTYSLFIPWKKGLSNFGFTSLVQEKWWEGGWIGTDYCGTITEVNQSATIKQFLYKPEGTWDGDRWKAIYVQLCQKDFPTGFNVYITTRMDYWGWDSSYEACTKSYDYGDTWGTDAYSKMLNRSFVTITITKTGINKAKIRYDIIDRDNNAYYMEYSDIVVPEEGFSYRQTSDCSYAVITSYTPPTNN